MDSWNVTGFISVFFGRTGRRNTRRTTARRRIVVWMSIAAMPDKTYRLRP
jgi:hypothetical protein